MIRNRKFISFILTIVMVLSMGSFAFAADTDGTAPADPAASGATTGGAVTTTESAVTTEPAVTATEPAVTVTEPAVEAPVVSTPQAVIIALQINNPAMDVDGKNVNIDENGTTPVIVDGRTLLPVRAVVEAMGGVVGWDQATKTVTLTVGEDVVKLTINSTAAVLNDEAKTLDVAPVIINSRTMLPIRFVMESFGGQVGWNAKTKTVTLAYPAGNMPEDLKAFVDAELTTVSALAKKLSGDWADKHAALIADKDLDPATVTGNAVYTELKKVLDDVRASYGEDFYVYAVVPNEDKEYCITIDGSAEPDVWGENYGWEVQFDEAWAGEAAAARSAWYDSEDADPYWSVFAPVLTKDGKVTCIIGIDAPCAVVEKYPTFNRDEASWNGFEE